MNAPRKKKSVSGSKRHHKIEPAVGSLNISRQKKWCFRLLIALGVPLILLGMLALVLVLVGFGYPTSFLLSSRLNGKNNLVQNNQFGWRFFGPAMARLPEPFCFPEIKGSNTVRIIVFGESAALGDPQPDFGLPRMLEAMLELRYPGTHFEVINAAIVAINSNVVLPIARDCTKANADIWVIYMGNNEVVGPFGAGTVFGQQVPPLPLIHASLALKTTRLGQLIETLRSKMQKPPPDKSEWGGMEMFLNQQVRLDDLRMGRVYDHFLKNLADIIRTGRKNGAGIVLSTVAVNLKDCAPFASEHRQGFSAGQETKWAQLYQNGVAAQSTEKIEEAARWFRAAAQIDNQFADLRFRQGACALALGNILEAQKQFTAACDLDTLRFRCDSRLNDLIRQTASDFNDPQLLLADAESAFAEQSPAGLPGSDLFYEHVHLTFDGNYLLARTLAPKVEMLLPEKITTQVASSHPWPSEADCARRLAWSDWDKQAALSEIFSRLGNLPFTHQTDHDKQIKNLEISLEKLAPAVQSAGITEAQNICAEALATMPDDPCLCEKMAALDQLSGNLSGAMTNAQNAVNLLPGSAGDWSQLGVIMAKQKKYEDAVLAFQRAFQLNPQDVWSLQNLAQSLNDLGRHEQAIGKYRQAVAIKPRFGPAWLGLGQIYEAMGRKTEADECYQNALRNRIDRAAELGSLARFCINHDWREAAATNFDDALKLNPFDAALQLEAGKNLSFLGRGVEAEKHFREAVTLVPDSIEARFFYGSELGRDGKPVEAVREFREAVRIMPNMVEARYNLGISLVAAGDYTEALGQFEKVLAQDPANAKALQYEQALRQKLTMSHSP